MAKPEEYEIVVIGGGSTGISMSFFLSCLKRKHVVLERGDSAGTFWKRNLWDRFQCATPGWAMQLPAMDVPREREEDFYSAKDVQEHLEAYCAKMQVPLKVKQDVTRITYEDDACEPEKRKLIIETKGGARYLTKDVVICTGSYQRPTMPVIAERLPPNIQSLHSSKYKNPDMVGQTVLVVGSGQSGLEITRELVDAGKNVFLALGDNTATFPRRYRGFDNMDWLTRMGHFDQDLKSMRLDEGAPTPEELRSQTTSSPYITDHPWPLFRLAQQGVVMLGRLKTTYQRENGHATVLEFDPLGQALEDSELSALEFMRAVDSFVAEEELHHIPPDPPYPTPPQIRRLPEILQLDLRHANIDTVIFATGYASLRYPMLDDLVKAKQQREQYNEIESVPVWFDDGYPATASGQMMAFPEIYFLGLRWLVSAASATMFGAPFDASIVATKIARMRGYPHQNMIAPQFLDPRIKEEDTWDVPDEEEDQHDSDSEDEGEYEEAALEEQKKYFPYADPSPLDDVADADILPPEPKGLDPNEPLPVRYIMEKPKRYKSRGLTDAELQRETKNQEIIAESQLPETIGDLQKIADEEQREAMAQQNSKSAFERWQPKLSKQKFREAKQGIDPFASNFDSEEKAIFMAAQKKLKGMKGKKDNKFSKQSNGQVFPMTKAMLKELTRDDDEPIRIVHDYSSKMTKQGVRGVVEQYMQGHRGLKDLKKGKAPRK